MPTNDPARRGFLRSLVTLPLIGGGNALFCNPSAAAEPISEALLDSYNAWLIHERMHLLEEMQCNDHFKPNTAGGMYHWQAYGTPRMPAPSTRAAIVLSAIGCDWREDGR